MQNPIQRKIGAIFVPVSEIEQARAWYARIFGFPADGPIINGHLYCPPMEGTASSYLVLDSKIWTGAPVTSYPLFHFNTDDIEAAYRYLQENGVEIIGGIQFGHFFEFKDLDGNRLMVCRP